MKRIQLLTICYNSSYCILKTLKTWEPYVDRFAIQINGGYNNDYSDEISIRSELKKLNKGCLIFKTDFKDFSQARNDLIKAVYDPNFTIIMIDDSYELLEFKNPLKFDYQSIQITDGYFCYHSVRIFNTKVEYIGKIHETVQTQQAVISGIRVYDRPYPQGHKRTMDRQWKQIELLKENQDPRSLYYTACAYTNLYTEGSVDEKTAKEAIYRRLDLKDFSNEWFLCNRLLTAFKDHQ